MEMSIRHKKRAGTRENILGQLEDYSKGADSEQMFSGLSIGKTQKKYLNKYDVIHIDVQWFLANCEDKNKVVQFITKSVLDELREIYPECLIL